MQCGLTIAAGMYIVNDTTNCHHIATYSYLYTVQYYIQASCIQIQINYDVSYFFFQVFLLTAFRLPFFFLVVFFFSLAV